MDVPEFSKIQSLMDRTPLWANLDKELEKEEQISVEDWRARIEKPFIAWANKVSEWSADNSSKFILIFAYSIHKHSNTYLAATKCMPKK